MLQPLARRLTQTKSNSRPLAEIGDFNHALAAPESAACAADAATRAAAQGGQEICDAEADALNALTWRVAAHSLLEPHATCFFRGVDHC
jgi:hypothetical protein